MRASVRASVRVCVCVCVCARALARVKKSPLCVIYVVDWASLGGGGVLEKWLN